MGRQGFGGYHSLCHMNLHLHKTIMTIVICWAAQVCKCLWYLQLES